MKAKYFFLLPCLALLGGLYSCTSKGEDAKIVDAQVVSNDSTTQDGVTTYKNLSQLAVPYDSTGQQRDNIDSLGLKIYNFLQGRYDVQKGGIASVSLSAQPEVGKLAVDSIVTINLLNKDDEKTTLIIGLTLAFSQDKNFEKIFETRKNDLYMSYETKTGNNKWTKITNLDQLTPETLAKKIGNMIVEGLKASPEKGTLELVIS